jgi:tetratricopeptide (TPR) repeat protein
MHPAKRLFGIVDFYFCPCDGQQPDMKRIEKTVFLSYRRTNAPWALAIFQNLTQHGYDVFFDFSGIASGDFERVIIGNIKARAHFLVVLTPSALQRCGDPGDWLRREIETALATKRNIVPLMLEGFNFGAPRIANKLTGKLARLKHYNALRVPADYFEVAMQRLRETYLNVALDAVLHPPSPSAQRAAKDEQIAAGAAPAVTEKELTAQEWLERGFNAADPDEKLWSYSDAIPLNPYYALVFRTNFERIGGDYDKAIRVNPDDANAFNDRGLARIDKGDLEGALQDFDRAVRLNPDYAIAYNNRGLARKATGDLKGAQRDFGKAARLRSKPGQPLRVKHRLRYP